MEERKFSGLERKVSLRGNKTAVYVCTDGLSVGVSGVYRPITCNDLDVECQSCVTPLLSGSSTPSQRYWWSPSFFRNCAAINCIILTNPDSENEEYVVVISGTVLSRTADELIEVRGETKELVFPETVRRAQREAIVKARGLCAVHFSKGLEVFGDEYPSTSSAESETSRLRELWFSSLPLRMEPGILQSCEGLRYVCLPDGLEVVQEGWFQESSIVRIDISRSVREVQPHAFYGCTQLRQVVLTADSMLELIDVGAFRGTALETFVAPPSLRVVAQEAFRECEMLRSVVLNEGLEQLGTDDLDEIGDQYRGPFYDSGLEKIFLSSTIHRIFSDAFECCPLRSVYLPGGVEVVLERVFKVLVATVRAPLDCGELQASTLYRSPRIKELRFAEPCSLRTICAEMFTGSALRKFVAPASLQEICRSAFRRCR